MNVPLANSSNLNPGCDLALALKSQRLALADALARVRFSLTRPFQQRKSQRTMGERASAEDADRSRDIAFQIGCSKAIRNVGVNALQTFADYAFEEARGALVGRIGNALPKYRDETVKKIAARGVELKRIEAVVGRSAADWLAPEVAHVIAMMKSVADGMATIDETFPPLGTPAARQPAGSKLDDFAKPSDSGASRGAPDEAAEGE